MAPFTSSLAVGFEQSPATESEIASGATTEIAGHDDVVLSEEFLDDVATKQSLSGAG